jgi:DEAD/DEAH box helicase domain-containing protein
MDSPTLFVFDKYPYGMGFSEKAYGLTDDIMQATADILHNCQCRTGCPSCVGASTPAYATSRIESGTRGKIPDKEAALILLHHMLELEPYVPRYAPPSGSSEGAGGSDEREKESKPSTGLPEHLEKNIRDRLK